MQAFVIKKELLNLGTLMRKKCNPFRNLYIDCTLHKNNMTCVNSDDVNQEKTFIALLTF